jgi:hypothetical protein
MTAVQSPVSHQHRFHVNPWMLAAIVLAAALVALGVWVLVDRAQTTTAPPQAAAPTITPQHVKATFDAVDTFAKAGNWNGVRALYADNATLDDLNGRFSMAGSGHVADHVLAVTLAGDRLRVNGEPIILGNGYVVVPVTLYAKGEPVSSGNSGAAVYQFDAHGAIVHQWMTPME